MVTLPADIINIIEKYCKNEKEYWIIGYYKIYDRGYEKNHFYMDHFQLLKLCDNINDVRMYIINSYFQRRHIYMRPYDNAKYKFYCVAKIGHNEEITKDNDLKYIYQKHIANTDQKLGSFCKIEMAEHKIKCEIYPELNYKFKINKK